MSIATVVTRGYGSYGTIPFVVVRGYSIASSTVTVDGHDPGIKEPDWEAYRRKQLELRDKLEAAYANATGEELPAEVILEQPTLPRARPVRRALSAVRKMDLEVRQQMALHTEAYRRFMEQDEEDAVIALLLH